MKSTAQLKELELIDNHLQDILNECNCPQPDIEQIEHNVYEVREHLILWAQ